MNTDSICRKGTQRAQRSVSASIASLLSTFSHQPSTLVIRARCRFVLRSLAVISSREKDQAESIHNSSANSSFVKPV